jgi:hypothetical protein
MAEVATGIRPPRSEWNRRLAGGCRGNKARLKAAATRAGARRSRPLQPISCHRPRTGAITALRPSLQPGGENPLFHGDHTGRLATGQPVVDSFTFKGLVKLLTGLNGVLVIAFNHLIVHPIYRPSNRSSLRMEERGGERWKSKVLRRGGPS